MNIFYQTQKGTHYVARAAVMIHSPSTFGQLKSADDDRSFRNQAAVRPSCYYK